MEDERETFLSKSPQVSGNLDNEGAELKSLRLCLKWVCLDQSNLWRASLSWSIFFLLAIGVPIGSHFALDCSSCDENHSRPYRPVVQLSLSIFATISFLCLSIWSNKHGLRKFLFLDQLSDASEKVQHGYTKQLQKETEVGSILVEHLKIRRNLRIISHRFRAFIFLTLVLVTASQFTTLLDTVPSSANVNIFKAGELIVCSISLVTGLFICLRSATKITHKAQSLTSLAAKWHACATINPFDNTDGETPRARTNSSQVFSMNHYWESDDEEDGDDDLDNTKLVPIFTHTISFQKRQALVTYLENNKAGITVFGFMLDRTGLRSIFLLELALFLWLLKKTIDIS
nr:uncharacterized protein LOC111997413 isoform X2 [Quercus suber]